MQSSRPSYPSIDLTTMRDRSPQPEFTHTTEPHHSVFGIGRASSERFFGLTLLSLVLQIAFGIWMVIVSTLGLSVFAHRVHALVHDRLAIDYEVDIAKDEPPPPPKEEEPEPPPKAEPVAVKHTEPAAAAPAQAGKALVSDTPAADNEPVAFDIPIGNAADYAGGTTSSTGTSKTAVTSINTRPDGAGNGSGTAPAAPPAPVIDRTRPAGLLRNDWSCPFPPEADQVDEAVVRLQVAVTADGAAQSVKVVSDPGNGFGREARRCALRERYRPAYDMQGNPVATSVTIPVRFTR